MARRLPGLLFRIHQVCGVSHGPVGPVGFVDSLILRTSDRVCVAAASTGHASGFYECLWCIGIALIAIELDL